VSSRRRWIIVWVLACLPLMGWWLYGLFDVDEGFYGAVVAEMNRRGEWITPYYNGKAWFEKPILLYWLAKPCLALFGDMIGPRLPSILTTLGTYGAVAWFANRRLGATVAQLSVLFLASSLLVVGTGRMMLTDLPLLLSLTAAMLTFWESLVGRPSYRVWTAAWLGIGVLSKGPVALILFAIIAGWTYWREKELRPAFRGYWVHGTVVVVLIIGSWYIPAYLVNGQVFVQKFLVEQNIGRFTGGDAAHTLGGVQSLVLYVPILFLGMFPWSVYLWKAWPRRSPRPNEATESCLEEGQLVRYLASWAAVIFIFFTISGAKLPHYILPVIPPLAILVAVDVVKRTPDPKKWFYAAGVTCLMMTVVANAVFLWWYGASGQKEVHAIVRYVRNEGGAVAIYQMGRRNKDLGTGKLKLQETSLPSLLMYLDSTAIDTDDFNEILRTKAPVWIVTREGRIVPADFRAAQRAGRVLSAVKSPMPQDNYRLYQVK